MNCLFKKTIICTLLALTFVFGISAATWSEMRENGEVSDGGISYGDPRDGVVSDVSDDSEGLVPEISSAIDDGLGIGSGDMTHDATDDPLMGGMGETNTSETGRETTNATNNTTNGNNNDGMADNQNRGMSAGIIIAILVVVAVVVIIFILLPKKR